MTRARNRTMSTVINTFGNVFLSLLLVQLEFDLSLEGT